MIQKPHKLQINDLPKWVIKRRASDSGPIPILLRAWRSPYCSARQIRKLVLSFERCALGGHKHCWIDALTLLSSSSERRRLPIQSANSTSVVDTSYSNGLVAENKFVSEGRTESSGSREVILLEAGSRGVMSLGGILFWPKCRRVGGVCRWQRIIFTKTSHAYSNQS